MDKLKEEDTVITFAALLIYHQSFFVFFYWGTTTVTNPQILCGLYNYIFLDAILGPSTSIAFKLKLFTKIMLVKLQHYQFNYLSLVQVSFFFF